MKVTLIDEIEAHKAWSNRMICPRCNEFKYKIHHQIQPLPEQWWIECENYGYESNAVPTRKFAIERWRQR